MFDVKPWNDRVAVGNPWIDDDHRLFVQSCSSAIERLRGNVFTQAEFYEWLHDFTAKMQRHIAEEEQTLARNGCPELLGHKREHESYLKGLQELRETGHFTREDRIGFAALLASFVNQHISETDLVSAPYLKDSPQNDT